ncbi:MAG TPA: F420-nonreducing hydrogenase [Candidatus Acidoferrales bacterium]|nr:F420-nonreducing hydrogenase [Candidatus Acidoferrales bacterium]
MTKPKIAFNWASSCGGCEIAILELGTKLVELKDKIDIVFWPAAMDFKYSDLEAMPDKNIDVTFFNGAIQNSENEHMAQLLRAKSKILVAFGACAYMGGIPALANTKSKQQIFNSSYKETPTTDNPQGIVPQSKFQTPEGELTIPELYNTVKTLGQVVDVDYSVPGCPPVGPQVEKVVGTFLSGELPPKGAVLGASDKSLCHECKLEKTDRKVAKLVRTYETIPDPKKCLLEQGIVCMGPATRGGCGAICMDANNPCKGCYGPLPNVVDQGAKMLSALASILDADDEETIQNLADGVVDPIGTFYRYGLAKSLLRRTKQ